LRLVVLVELAYLVPSITDRILERKLTILPSKNCNSWDYSRPKIAWKSSWYSEFTFRITPSI